MLLVPLAPPPWEIIGYLPEEGLDVGVPAAESQEPDRSSGEQDLCPDQPMRLGGVGQEPVPKDGGDPVGVRAAEEDDFAGRRNRRVEVPRPGEQDTTRWRFNGPPTPALPGGRNVRGGEGLEGGQ